MCGKSEQKVCLLQVCANSVMKFAEVDNADSPHLPPHTLIMRTSTHTYLRMCIMMRNSALVCKIPHKYAKCKHYIANFADFHADFMRILHIFVQIFALGYLRIIMRNFYFANLPTCIIMRNYALSHISR